MLKLTCDHVAKRRRPSRWDFGVNLPPLSKRWGINKSANQSGSNPSFPLSLSIFTWCQTCCFKIWSEFCLSQRFRCSQGPFALFYSESFSHHRRLCLTPRTEGNKKILVFRDTSSTRVRSKPLYLCICGRVSTRSRKIRAFGSRWRLWLRPL